jgi:hypothetical protein
MSVSDGVRSIEGLRRKAKPNCLGVARLLIATLSDTIKSKRAAGRAREMTVLHVSRKAKLEALKKKSELALRDQIRRSLTRPPERRTHFLRKRVGFRITCI